MEERTKPEYFKQRLLDRINELEALIDTGDDAARPVELDQSRVGRLSRMDAMQAQAMSVEAKRRRDIELLKINAALLRIESDCYGFCLECDEAINVARLDFDPATALCIDCAKKKES